MHEPSAVSRRPVAAEETAAANRRWWDSDAARYQAEHGDFLGGPSGGADFVWGPEGLREAAARLLGDVRGARVVEVGCGAGQCSRWLVGAGAVALGVDLSFAQLVHSRRLDACTGIRAPVVQGDARRLPLASASVDLACSAFGALPFVADSDVVQREVARVLRPGGRWVFSVTHPVRWCFPDDPGHAGLRVVSSYFDRRPYVEQDRDGVAPYVEHHRTLGDWIRSLVAAGLVLVDLLEPEWPVDHQRPWGQWSPLRGKLIPGTAIFVCVKSSR